MDLTAITSEPFMYVSKVVCSIGHENKTKCTLIQKYHVTNQALETKIVVHTLTILLYKKIN